MIEKIKSTRYVKYSLEAEIVFITKNNQVFFCDEHISLIKETFEDICNKNGCSISNFQWGIQNVHFILHFLPRTSISILVNSIKTVSSRKLRQSYIQFKNDAVWNRSYLVLSLGKPNTLEIDKFKNTIFST